MKRYHKKVYMPDIDKDRLISFTYRLNKMSWQYTNHCLDKIKLRGFNLKQLLYYIKTELKLDYESIFEYYTNKDKIDKVCYRLSYNNNIDLILVIGKRKQIITIYDNKKDDLHYTLNTSLYMQKV